jgi:hypothetical protein
MQLERLNINKKYRVLTSASQQRELYLNAVHPFCCVFDGLQCRIGDALSIKSTSQSMESLLMSQNESAPGGTESTPSEIVSMLSRNVSAPVENAVTPGQGSPHMVGRSHPLTFCPRPLRSVHAHCNPYAPTGNLSAPIAKSPCPQYAVDPCLGPV